MTTPMYVKIEKHRDLRDMLGAINTKLAAVEKSIDRINQLKGEEDLQLQSWHDNLSYVKARLQRINQEFQG